MKATMKKKATIKKAQPEGQIVQVRGEAGKGLDNLRQCFVEEGPDGMEKLLDLFDGPIAMFVKNLSEIPFTHLGSTRSKKSLQEQLITVLKKTGAKNIEEQYISALKSARGALFDAITADMLRFLPEEPGLSMALWRALIIQNPSVLPENKGAVEYVVNSMMRRGFDFLEELVDDRRNFSVRRKDKTCRLNELLWMLAANWTNPHFPLWLMQTPAICSACKLLGATSPLLGAVNKIIERAKLTRRGRKNPIKEVRVASRYSKMCIFTVKGSEFLALHGETSTLNFIRPFAKIQDSKDILNAFDFERQRRELLRIRKSAGESSEEFDNAWKAMTSQFDLSQIAPIAYRVEVEK